jgi:hypothetical protein
MLVAYRCTSECCVYTAYNPTLLLLPQIGTYDGRMQGTADCEALQASLLGIFKEEITFSRMRHEAMFLANQNSGIPPEA